MRTLVFITAHFPFSSGETFIDSEYPYLSKSFDKIILIAQDVSGQQTRKTFNSTSIYRYNPATSFIGFLILPFQLLANSRQIVNLIKDEAVFRNSIRNGLSTKKFFILFKKIVKAIQLRDFIVRILRKDTTDGPIVLYSYWLKSGAHALAMMKDRDYLRISRGHRGDIYEENTESRYLPLLKFTAQELDMIFFISENGRKYFENKTRVIRPEVLVSYLGVNGPEELKDLPENDEFTIISCSNIIPIKRVDMIIKALELLDTDKKIKWLHFGDGILRKEIEVLAAEKLNDKRNITYSLMGYYANKDLLNYYDNNRIDLFLNTSSSEGLPVSIMEAQSYGIPVIATDVGGIVEIVTEGTGHTLKPSFEPHELKDLIITYINMGFMEREAMRTNAHNNWKQKFNAETNYSNFTAIIDDQLSRKSN